MVALFGQPYTALYNLTDKTVTWVGNEQFDNPNACFTFSL